MPPPVAPRHVWRTAPRGADAHHAALGESRAHAVAPRPAAGTCAPALGFARQTRPKKAFADCLRSQLGRFRSHLRSLAIQVRQCAAYCYSIACSISMWQCNCADSTRAQLAPGSSTAECAPLRSLAPALCELKLFASAEQVRLRPTPMLAYLWPVLCAPLTCLRPFVALADCVVA